jgi:hypothetical protein
MYNSTSYIIYFARKNYFFLLNQLKTKYNKKNIKEIIAKILLKSFLLSQTHFEIIFFSKLDKYFSKFSKDFLSFAIKNSHDKALEIFFKFFLFNFVITYFQL